MPVQHYRLTRLVTGWLPYWQNKSGAGAGWSVVRTHLGMLDQVSLFAADADGATGAVTANFGAPDGVLNGEIATLHSSDVAALLTVTHFNNVHDLLVNPAALQNVSDGIVRILNRYNLDGVDIDFEDFRDKDPADTARYTQFLSSLAERLHGRLDSFGFPTTVAATILARTDRGRFTYADETALADTGVDQVRIMAYDEYSPGSAKAGACAPLPWVAKVAGFLRGLDAPTWKYMLGIPGYGYEWPVAGGDDWTTTAKGRSLPYLKATALIAEHHAPRRWSDDQQAPYLSYDAGGQHHIAFYEDAESWFRKVDQIVAAGGDASAADPQPPIGGVSEWAFGYEDPLAWSRVQKRLLPTYNIYAAIGLCYARFGGGARFGEPLTPEQNCGPALSTAWNAHVGRQQRFANAAFYYKWGSPRAYFVEGEMQKRYEAQGGADGPLGFPVSDPRLDQTGQLSQEFEHGSLAIHSLLFEPKKTQASAAIATAGLSGLECVAVGAAALGMRRGRA